MNDHQEEMARALFEEAGDAMFLCDPDTDQILDVNPMAERLSGFCRAELLGMTITALLRFEDKGGEQRLHRAASQTGVFHSQEGFFLRTRQDNVWIPVNLTVTRLHVHPKTLALMTARDIREQHEASTQLRKMETELRRVLASVPDCLWSADIDAQGRWTFRFFSPVVQKITGRPADFFLGGLAHWRDLIHPEDRPRWKQALVGLRAGQSTQIEYRLVRPDGGVRWVRDSVAVSRGEEERTLRLDGVLTDISDRKEAEEALRSTEEELRIAHRIQKKLFPSRPPVIPGFDIGGASYAAAATGG
ncbi:MAG: PAS domain S-box protein, partial [Planctomycetes bacterium]|nr:PAS domain S-box protein [Planctomycetota bacterium]